MEDQELNTPVNDDTSLLGEFDHADLNQPEPDTSIDVRGPEQKEVTKLERPEDLPPELWDEEQGNFKTNELFEEWKKERTKALGLRQKLSKGMPKPPESPESYQIDFIKDKLKEGVEIDENDEGINIFRRIAHKNGLDQEKFESIFSDYIEEMSKLEPEKGDDQESFSPEQQKEYIQTEMKKLGDNGPAIISAIKNWNRQLYLDGLMSEEDFKTASRMGLDANEIRILNIYRQAAGDLSVPESVNVVDGLPSQEEINAILRNPNYENDPRLQKQVTDYYQKKYG